MCKRATDRISPVRTLDAAIGHILLFLNPQPATGVVGHFAAAQLRDQRRVIEKHQFTFSKPLRQVMPDLASTAYEMVFVISFSPKIEPVYWPPSISKHVTHRKLQPTGVTPDLLSTNSE